MANYTYRKKTKKKLVENIDNHYFAAWSTLTNEGRIAVYVEGYEDISFWRNIFDDFTTETRRFQIMTPARQDLAKGKKVVLSFSDKAGPNLLLCVDADFDHLFPNSSPQAHKLSNCPYLVHTYTYAIENLQCYPPSLQSVVAKATKTDLEIFDFDAFFAHYSETIYPVFLWYVWAAISSKPEVFSLSDFRNTVRINYLDLHNNGTSTISWVTRQIEKRLAILERQFPHISPELHECAQQLEDQGVTPQKIHYYMQGHTLLDHVVKPLLETICQSLRQTTLATLDNSRANTISQRNQVSYYNNSLTDLDTLISDNQGYKKSDFYAKINARISEILQN